MVLLTQEGCAVLGRFSAKFLRPPVGASLLAKNVNDNAALRVASDACAFFASKLAPTENRR